MWQIRGKLNRAGVSHQRLFHANARFGAAIFHDEQVMMRSLHTGKPRQWQPCMQEPWQSIRLPWRSGNKTAYFSGKTFMFIFVYLAIFHDDQTS